METTVFKIELSHKKPIFGIVTVNFGLKHRLGNISFIDGTQTDTDASYSDLKLWTSNIIFRSDTQYETVIAEHRFEPRELRFETLIFKHHIQKRNTIWNVDCWTPIGSIDSRTSFFATEPKLKPRLPNVDRKLRFRNRDFGWEPVADTYCWRFLVTPAKPR